MNTTITKPSILCVTQLRAFMPVYIEKSGDLVGCYRSLTDRQTDNRTRSSWLNCALRDDEAVYWVSIGHLCLYILKKVEIWSGVTDVLLTHRLQNIVLLSLSKVKS